MKKTMFTFPAIAAFALLLGASSALAQQAAPPAQEQQAPASMTAQGELVKVDADAKTISIKGAGDKELVFSYNDRTEVTGAREGVAGLATKAGTKVIVHYTSDKDVKTATKIEVQSRESNP